LQHLRCKQQHTRLNHNNGAGCIRQANITITVNERPAVTTQPVATTTCSGATATFTVAGVGAGLTYQWQLSTAGCAGPWTNIANAAPYSGATTATLTVNPTAVAMNGYAYRCVLGGTCSPVNNANISNCAVLNVNPLPVVTVTPASGCGGVAGINGLLLTAGGANTYTWTPVTGLYTNATATTAYTGGNTPSVYAAPTAYTAYTVTGTNTATGCSNTATALINYTPPAPTIVPSSVTMCLGDPAVMLKSSSAQSFTGTFTSGTVNVVIPDGPTIPPVPTSYPASVSNITVSGIPAGAIVTNVRAKFNVTHAYVGDLVMALKAPNGNVFNLDAMLNRTNNAGANFTNTVISSAGTNLLSAGTAPFTNTYKPDAAGATFTAFGFTFPGGPTGYIPNVASFSGLYSVPNGVWSIGIYDAGAPDAGVLNNWSLDIDYVIGVPATPAVWTPAAGLFSDANATVPYVAGTAVDSVWTRPTPSGVYPYQATVQSLPVPPATVNTPMAGGNGNFLVAFNVRNNNGYPVTFSSISSNAFGSGAVVSRVFYKTTAIAGAPGAIDATNGWTQFGTANNTVTANTLNLLMSGLSLSIPPGATYGIALDFTGATTPAYTNGTGTIATYSTGGVDIITDGNVGWGGPAAPGVPVNNPRNFNGAVTFTASVTPCTSPARTVVVTVNQPTTLNAALPANQTICTDKVATFTAAVTAGTGPHSYQWQVSTNGGGTYTNVANGGVYSGATTATLTVTAPPVTMSGYLFRCVVTGAAPCAAQTSRAATLTVNPLPVIVLSAGPYTSLFPGLRTTISSNVTPNPAATYTWLRNGVVLAGATTGSVNVDVDGLGDYQLRVTDVNGCNNSSNIVTIKDSASGKCFIYPNPNSGQFQVRYYSVANNVVPRGIVVYDAKGDRILSQNYTIGRPYDRMDVDMRAKGKGLYWVEVVDRNGNRLTMCRVVIQ
jgi:subtilisin-like proprotein convertase family protein